MSLHLSKCHIVGNLMRQLKSHVLSCLNDEQNMLTFELSLSVHTTEELQILNTQWVGNLPGV